MWAASSFFLKAEASSLLSLHTSSLPAYLYNNVHAFWRKKRTAVHKFTIRPTGETSHNSVIRDEGQTGTSITSLTRSRLTVRQILRLLQEVFPGHISATLQISSLTEMSKASTEQNPHIFFNRHRFGLFFLLLFFPLFFLFFSFFPQLQLFFLLCVSHLPSATCSRSLLRAWLYILSQQLLFSFGPLCAIKPSISKLLNSLLYSFLVILFFLTRFSNSSHHFAKLFGVHLFKSAAIHEFWSHSLPRISRTPSAPNQNISLPVHSSDQVMTSQIATSPFSKSFRQKFWSRACTWHLHVFASFSASHTSKPVCFRAPLCSMFHSLPSLVDKTSLFLRLWPEFLTIFPFLH